MNKTSTLVLLTAVAAAAGCAPQESEEPASAPAATAPAEAPQEAGMTLPVTTSSDTARQHFEAGLYALDMARINDANALFEKAVVADPTFASGYLFTALSAASTEEFADNLALAAEHAGNTSRAEQLLVEAFQKGFDNDVEGQLATARQLTDLHPDVPRGWRFRANFEAGMNRIADSRVSLEKALALNPDSAAAHMQAGNNYLFLEPKDFQQAEAHFKKAVTLAPDEPNPYDLMGDVHRAQNKLDAAYGDYTMAAERAPAMGSPLQQRGHVNSFLGNFDEARADYTRSMELELARGNNNARFFELWRALVSVHEGEPEAAVRECREMVARADEGDFEGKLDLKTGALAQAAQIAAHHGDFAAAESLIAEMAQVMREQATEVATPEFGRAQEATITYWEGMLAARRGDADAARSKAEEYGSIVEPDPNPRKLERMHEILGFAEFYQEEYGEAAAHLAQGNPNTPYTKYYRALSHAEHGEVEEAGKMLRELAVLNFNGPGYALIRKDVLERVAQN